MAWVRWTFEGAAGLQDLKASGLGPLGFDGAAGLRDWGPAELERDFRLFEVKSKPRVDKINWRFV